MKPNLIDQAYESYERHQRARGYETDEVSFVGGFLSAFGILSGKVPVGLPEDTTILAIFELLHKELDGYRNRVIGAQGKEGH